MNAQAPDRPLVRTRELGRLRIHALDAGLQRLDGGAMFGVVPKPLWERRIPADERNRIPLALRCLLVETADELVLIETGLGNKETDKFIGIYGVENEASPGSGAADRLQEAIGAAGFASDEVSVVINTHLHFDHAGGNTFLDEEDEVRIAFPQARYYVQRGEWEYAHQTNERTQASYFPPNFDPVEAAGQLHLLEGEEEVIPGISVLLTPGHCPFHQSVLVQFRRSDRLLRGRSDPDHGAPAAPLDHGIRCRTAPHAGGEARAARVEPIARAVATRLRARSRGSLGLRERGGERDDSPRRGIRLAGLRSGLANFSRQLQTRVQRWLRIQTPPP